MTVRCLLFGESFGTKPDRVLIIDSRPLSMDEIELNAKQHLPAGLSLLSSMKFEFVGEIRTSSVGRVYQLADPHDQ